MSRPLGICWRATVITWRCLRLQIGRRLQGKMDPVDLVQDTFLEAHRDFPHFRGQSEGELVSWLRRILVRNLANALRHYFGTQGRDIRLERELSAEIDQSSQVLDRGLIAPISSPSQQASQREQVVLLADALGACKRTIAKRSFCATWKA